MNSPHKAAPASLSNSTDEIDLRDLMRLLWRQRLVIVVFVIVGSLLGVGLSLNSTRYVSEGLFLVSALAEKPEKPEKPELSEKKVSIDAYRRYESVLFNGSRLQKFLQQNGRDVDPDGQKLQSLIDSRADLSKALTPDFGLSERDAKTFGVRVQSDQPSFLLGIRLRYAAREPTGGSPTLLLAEYVRDSIIRVDMEEEMLNSCVKFRASEQELQNEQIKNDFEIAQEQSRAQTLKGLITSRPGSDTPDIRQIIAVEKGAERFLSPVSQLTAAEINIANMKLADIRRKRELTASVLKREYYCKAQKALQSSVNGRAFLGELKSIQDSLFAEQDKSADIVEQTWNELSLQREVWIDIYLSKMRFAASPQGAEFRERKPGLAFGLALGFVLGGILGLLVAAVRDWWRSGQTTAASGSR